MHIMCYDFETNGLPLFDQPSDDPRQPHIVQAAAALVDSDTRKLISGFNLIARPNGWEIPAEVVKVHGITTELAAQVGVSESLITSMLLDLWERADCRLGHNESFDARIGRIAIKRFIDDEVADHWKAGKAECTARLASPIMKMAPTAKMVAAGRRHSKTPKLTEAYEHFTGRKLENAHSAMADVQGCIEVYWAIKDGVTAEFVEEVTAPATHSDDGDLPFLR